jgi:ribonuclease G
MQWKPKNAGLICRTVGEGKGEKEFEQDVKYLLDLWTQIEQTAATAQAPALIHREMELTTGLIRDLFTEDIDRVVIDSGEAYRGIQSYLSAFAPELRNRVKLFKGEGPVFDEYGIEAEIAKSLERKVWLKKGGYIVIDHTEALVAIDVNTGRFTGKRSPEDTISRRISRRPRRSRANSASAIWGSSYATSSTWSRMRQATGPRYIEAS